MDGADVFDRLRPDVKPLDDATTDRVWSQIVAAHAASTGEPEHAALDSATDVGVHRGSRGRRLAVLGAVAAAIVGVLAIGAVAGRPAFVPGEGTVQRPDPTPDGAPDWYSAIAPGLPPGFQHVAVMSSHAQYVVFEALDPLTSRLLYITVTRGAMPPDPGGAMTLDEARSTPWTDPGAEYDVSLPDGRQIGVSCLVPVGADNSPGCPPVNGVTTDAEDLRALALFLADQLDPDDLPAAADQLEHLPVELIRAAVAGISGLGEPITLEAQHYAFSFVQYGELDDRDVLSVRVVAGFYPPLDPDAAPASVSLDGWRLTWQAMPDGMVWSVVDAPDAGLDVAAVILDEARRLTESASVDLGITEPATTGLPTTVPSSAAGAELVCDASGCDGFDPLPVAPGATDFYVGPAGLGEPELFSEGFQDLTRCAELTAVGDACERIEGIAGAALATYPLVEDDPLGQNTIEVGTTFTTLTPQEYAGQWGMANREAPVTTGVRGHDAVRSSPGAWPAVVWSERPGVLVWVRVPPDRENDLLAIAEGVRAHAGPTSIPHLVLVPGFGQPWDTTSNNADGLLVAVSGAVECVGYGYVDQCGQTVSERLATRTGDDGSTMVAGSTPSSVTSVSVKYADGTTISVDTVAFPPYTSRFFLAEPKPSPRVVEWLDDADQVVESGMVVLTGPAVHAGPVAVVDASGDPGSARALADALMERGIEVVAVYESSTTSEETMVMPIGESTQSSYTIAGLIGVGGFDSWTPSLIDGPLDSAVIDVVVLGTDGGPNLPLPFHTALG